MFSSWFKKKEEKKEEKIDLPVEKPKGLTLVIAGSLKDFERWCKLNSSDLSQQNTRNVIDYLNVMGLPVEQVENIVVTGKFWNNKILMSVPFRNFFREWEVYNETKIK